MFEFSMSSLLMSVLFSNVLLILLYGIFRNTDFMMDIGHQLLAFFLGATLIRFLFPFELPFSVRLIMPEGISRIGVLINKARFPIGTKVFSIWHLFLLLWAVGCIIGICLFIRACKCFQRSVRVLGVDITNKEPCHTTLEQICIERKQVNNFRVVTMPTICSPMITGLFHPVIMIPHNLSLDPKEWNFILSHETAHYYHHDLWLKLLTQLLCILYWWNPLIYAFRRQVSTMLELRTDRYVTAFSDPLEKFYYMKCLSYIMKHETSTLAPLSISFCITRESRLLQRFHMIGDSEGHKHNRRKQLLISFIIIGLYLFSTFFIFEPHYTSPKVAESSYMLSNDNAYFIVNPNGGYDLYVEDQFTQTFYNPIDEIFHDLNIYQTKEEIVHD